MRKSTFFALAALLALAGLGAGIVFNHWLGSKARTAADAHHPAAEAGPTTRPLFSLVDADGNPRSIAEWDGKVILLNFWATWCPPCRREIPAFIDLHERYAEQGLAVIGVAIDTPDAVQDFIDPMGVTYPILIGETEAIAAAKAYGNRLGVLPYTAIIDRSGKIVSVHASELSFERAEALIRPLL